MVFSKVPIGVVYTLLCFAGHLLAKGFTVLSVGLMGFIPKINHRGFLGLRYHQRTLQYNIVYHRDLKEFQKT